VDVRRILATRSIVLRQPQKTALFEAVMRGSSLLVFTQFLTSAEVRVPCPRDTRREEYERDGNAHSWPRAGLKAWAGFSRSSTVCDRTDPRTSGEKRAGFQLAPRLVLYEILIFDVHHAFGGPDP
jgi:hypothetical protein